MLFLQQVGDNKDGFCINLSYDFSSNKSWSRRDQVTYGVFKDAFALIPK